MKVVIWANHPSPHQKDFYAALRGSGVDLRVVYLAPLHESRSAIGWSQPATLPTGDSFLPNNCPPLNHVEDWRSRVHVIPGYGHRVNRSLATQLSREKVPWVHWSENSQPSWRSVLSWGVKKWYAGLVNRHALGAFGIGECATQDFVRWGIRLEKCAHLYYAIDGVQSKVEPDPATREFVDDNLAFVYVGSLCRNKATLLLLKAFASAAAGCKAKLVLVGNGSHEEAARQFVMRAGLQDKVLLRGVVSNSAIGTVLNCCQVLILPSRYDGWGVVLNEAASAGLALIASAAVGGAYHLVEPGWNGFRVSAGSERSLQRAIEMYLNNPQLARHHGQNSAQLFEDFTPARNAKRFVTALRAWQDSSGETIRLTQPRAENGVAYPRRAA